MLTMKELREGSVAIVCKSLDELMRLEEMMHRMGFQWAGRVPALLETDKFAVLNYIADDGDCCISIDRKDGEMVYSSSVFYKTEDVKRLVPAQEVFELVTGQRTQTAPDVVCGHADVRQVYINSSVGWVRVCHICKQEI